MGKTQDIIVIIFNISLIIFMLIFEPSDYLIIKSRLVKNLLIFILILSLIISWMYFKGVFKERNSRIAEKFYNRGRTYSINGDQNAAISNYKMALNLDPNFAPAHQALGEIFYLKGEMIKSFEHINKAKESKQDEINSHEALKRNHVDENKKKTELKSEFIGEIYFNYEYGFSIKSPHGWRINTKLSPEMLVHFIDNRGGSVNLMVGPTYKKQESIEDLETLALRNVRNLSGEMISLKHIKVDNIEAIEAVYTALGGKIKKVGFVKDDIEYVISCKIKPNLFDKYEPIFDAFIQSFKFN